MEPSPVQPPLTSFNPETHTQHSRPKILLPRLVCKLSTKFGAWVVGSAANPNTEKPRDFDVVVPWDQWNLASTLIPPDATPNAFGGWKCKSGNNTIDVWPGDIAVALTHHRSTHAYQPHLGIRLYVHHEGQSSMPELPNGI